MRILLSLLAFAVASALDVELVDYECDSSLYVTADFTIKCNGHSRCTFGESNAVIAGELYYNQVSNTGIQNNVAYLSTDVELMTLSYNFNEMMPIPLCYYYLNPDDSNQYDCPGDGGYGFSINYKLPSAGEEKTSWLATGWPGRGTIRIYAEEDENMLIGECKLSLKVSVTPDEERGIFQTPSAAASVGILAGALAMMLLVCLWMRFCHRDPEEKAAEDACTALSADDINTLFKQLDEETRSRLSRTRSIRSYFSRRPRNSQISVPLHQPAKQPPDSGKTAISEMAL